MRQAVHRYSHLPLGGFGFKDQEVFLIGKNAFYLYKGFWDTDTPRLNFGNARPRTTLAIRSNF